MTTIEFGKLTRSGETNHAHSWSVSLVFHLLSIWFAMVLLAEIEKPRPMPFTWEVAMVEAPPKVEPAPVTPTPPPPVPTPVRPQTTPQVQRTVDQRPQVQTQQVQSQVQTQQVQPQIQTTVETVRQTVQDVATPVEQATATPVETAVHRTPVQSVETPAAVTETATPTVAAVVETSAPVAQVVTESSPVAAQVAVAHQPTVLEREAPVQSDSPTVEEKAVQHRVVHYRQMQADYGWLRDTLWKRIQELKRYPALARTNHWEGKVVVAAVIRDDGTVVGLRIAESSGRPILDQEALSVMRQASPLTLKHPLGKPQVTILVPISYRLDG